MSNGTLAGDVACAKALTITEILSEALEALRRCQPILNKIRSSAESPKPEPGEETKSPGHANNLRGLAGELKERAIQIERTVSNTASALGVSEPEPANDA